MSDQKEELHQFLLNSRAALLDCLNQLTDAQWQAVVFSDGNQWTANDILRHLVSAQRGMITQIAQIQQGGTGVPEDFDLARWNARAVQKTQDKTSSELLEDLGAGQTEALALLSAMQKDDFEKKGRHGSGRILTIAQIFHLIGMHEADHAKDIRHALSITA